MPDDYRKYLNAETVSKLKSIELKAKLIVEGFLTGLHKSPYHGFSAEFAEHRQYTLGDEVRHIDWRVFARTDKYYVKQFEEETNLRCYILLDTSSSMRYRSANSSISKIEYASYLAASLMLLMTSQRDAVSVITYNDKLGDVVPPSLKPSHQTHILKTLDRTSKLTLETKGVASNASAAFSEFAKRLTQRSLIIVLSDFWDEQESVISALKHFRHRRHETLAFHILDDAEITMNLGSTSAELVDLESGEKLKTSPKQIQSAYQTAFQDYTARYKRALSDNNIDYTLQNTSQTFDYALLAYLRKRGTV
jgi:uncharacterized protein (DUF58 family)